MSKIRTYLDSCVIVNAFRGETTKSCAAIRIIEDNSRIILFSFFSKLELLPKPIANKCREEIEFINTVFENAEFIQPKLEIFDKTFSIASKYGLSALDAFHIAAAIAGNANEMVSFERQTKPMYKMPTDSLKMVCLCNQ